jgi:DNA-binding transcriptional MerR regulator
VLSGRTAGGFGKEAARFSLPGGLVLDLERSRFGIVVGAQIQPNERRGRVLMSKVAEAPEVADHVVLAETFTVQQAVQLTGLSEHTLRYYERVGLLPPVRRQESSHHRRYSLGDISIIETLACLRAAGLPLEQMRRYIGLMPQGRSAAAQQRELLEGHRTVLQERLRGMQWNLEYIQRKIAYWSAVEAHDDQGAAEIARELSRHIRSHHRGE